MEKPLEVMLAWLGLSQYCERLMHSGFESWETLLEITEADLEVKLSNLREHPQFENQAVPYDEARFIIMFYGFIDESMLIGSSCFMKTGVGYRNQPPPQASKSNQENTKLNERATNSPDTRRPI